MHLIEWTDITLMLHGILSLTLGAMILTAARTVRGRRWWRGWPPAVLVLWGASEVLDGIIYLRRWASRETDLTFVDYGSTWAFVMNTLSMLAILALIWRIRRGDIERGPDPPQPWPPDNRGTV